jgi:hypothetical protein
VSDELLHTVLAALQRHDVALYARVISEHLLDLLQFDPVAANLHLLVHAAHEA